MADTTTKTTEPIDADALERHVHVLRCVHPARAEAVRFLDGGPLTVGRESAGIGGLALDDGEVSRAHASFEFDARFDGYSLRDLGSRNGTFLDGERVEAARLVDGRVVRVGQTVFVYCTEAFPVHLAPTRLPMGVSLRRDAVERRADLAARSNLPVLVRGPTGAGKERLAQRLHDASGRAGPLVSLNCATIAVTSSPASSSATSVAPSRGRNSRARVCSRRRTAARSSSTRSGRCPSTSSRRCCVLCRRVGSAPSAPTARSTSTCGSCARPTATSKRWSTRGTSDATS